MAKPEVCPQCGSHEIDTVIYGLPVWPLPPEQAAGGCIIGPDGPDWICRVCNHYWQTSDSDRARSWAEYTA